MTLQEIHNRAMLRNAQEVITLADVLVSLAESNPADPNVTKIASRIAKSSASLKRLEAMEID